MGEPHAYNLDDPAELQRLLRETCSYAKVSLHQRDGTDLTGRRYAYNALRSALALGYRLAPPEVKP